ASYSLTSFANPLALHGALPILLEDDPSEASRIARELDRLNSERRMIEQAAEAQAEAEALASLGLEDKGAIVVTASEGWHPGVVGDRKSTRLNSSHVKTSYAVFW